MNIDSVYDWERGTKLNAFVNTNPYGSRISSVKFINEEDMTIVMAASGAHFSVLLIETICGSFFYLFDI